MRSIRNSSPDRASDPMMALRSDVAAIKKDLAAVMGQQVGAVGIAMRTHVDDAATEMKHLAARAKKTARAAHEQLSDVAGARPLTTIAASAALGIVAAKMVGWMLRR